MEKRKMKISKMINKEDNISNIKIKIEKDITIIMKIFK
jgi:hypothetical protein